MRERGHQGGGVCWCEDSNVDRWSPGASGTVRGLEGLQQVDGEQQDRGGIM